MNEIVAKSPFTGEDIKSYRIPGENDIAKIYAEARGASGLWKEKSIARRIAYIRKLRALTASRADEIARLVSRAVGKSPVDALSGDVLVSLQMLSYYEKRAAKILADRRVAVPFYFGRSYSYVRRNPLGVVLIISPWNYPFQLAFVPLISAVIAGNAVILKPSEAALPVGEIIGSLCESAGMPDKLVQIVSGDGETGRMLVSARPDKIFFTGSPAVGRQVAEQAAKEIIPVSLELGGKDPMIIFADANFDRAVDGAAYGAFANAGQVCVAAKRIYVEDSIYDKFCGALAVKAAAISAGPDESSDIGVMSFNARPDYVEEQIEDAVIKGAENLTGTRRNGNYFLPVVLKNVDHSMKIMTEETFGPVAPVMRFQTESDALALAGDSRFGLGASVWTRDLKKAERIAGRIRAGSCAVNNVIANVGNPRLPFGGVRQSGYGRYHGPEGLYEFTEQISVMVYAGSRRRELNWFPYSLKVYNLLRALIDFIYSGAPVRVRVKNIIRIIASLMTGGSAARKK